VQNIQSTAPATKSIENGQLVIHLNDGSKYSATGVKIE
jgi:hypothetical protein